MFFFDIYRKKGVLVVQDKKSGTLNALGRFMCWLLDIIDPNHVEDAVKIEEG